MKILKTAIVVSCVMAGAAHAANFDFGLIAPNQLYSFQDTVTGIFHDKATFSFDDPQPDDPNGVVRFSFVSNDIRSFSINSTNFDIDRTGKGSFDIPAGNSIGNTFTVTGIGGSILQTSNQQIAVPGTYQVEFYAVPSIPEPATYAMMFAGLSAMFFVARRSRMQ